MSYPIVPPIMEHSVYSLMLIQHVCMHHLPESSFKAYLFMEKIENELTEQSNDNLISKRPPAEKRRRLFNKYKEILASYGNFWIVLASHSMRMAPIKLAWN
ncbi:hypothetical protein APICC_06226 [Apis cerana cerana]|uniref:Uncharacterized protein n=1 Tax=Apis cerana cerana TaxID=94128 RepID=A0A2A3EHB8_APICC|nr:hypothetical protein APICC_06226 [Apis cerana cerana]